MNSRSGDAAFRLRNDQKLIAGWIPERARVLDLGCGDGALLAELMRSRGVTGYGLEIDTDNVARCIAAGVNVIQADLDEGLQAFEDHSFDVVIMTQTIQDVRYPDRLLTEMVRVGGEGIVTFPNVGHWKCRWQLMNGRMPVTASLPDSWFNTPNIHICTVRDFEALCAARSIEVIERTTVDARHRPGLAMRFAPNLLGEVAIYRVKRRGT